MHLSLLRDGAWLTRERVLLYAAAAAVVYVLAIAHEIWVAAGLPGLREARLDCDFVAFWSAGSLALKGQAWAAYDGVLLAAEQSALAGGGSSAYHPWHYPPIFLLLVAPLALLPYAWALLAWLAATGAAYACTLRALVPRQETVLVALAFPAVFLNLWHGQNAFLTTALLACGLLSLSSNPVRAGFCFGLLCYKPQLVVLVPFALIAGRHWRALGAAAVTLASLVGASVLLFGIEAWVALESSSNATRRVLEGPAGYKMVTIFSAVRLLGGGTSLAWALQWVASLAAAGAVFLVWRRPGPMLLKGGFLAAMTLLATPFAYDYELVILSVALAALVDAGLREGFLAWERVLLAGAWLLPAMARAVAYWGAIPLAPLVAVALAVCLGRRLRAARATGPSLPGSGPESS